MNLLYNMPARVYGTSEGKFNWFRTRNQQNLTNVFGWERLANVIQLTLHELCVSYKLKNVCEIICVGTNLFVPYFINLETIEYLSTLYSRRITKEFMLRHACRNIWVHFQTKYQWQRDTYGHPNKDHWVPYRS